ncbi:MAG TPA: MFS transporter [Amycolatopsis sp.]|nr:MFS transporter [Amycolatopsis sp.]
MAEPNRPDRTGVIVAVLCFAGVVVAMMTTLLVPLLGKLPALLGASSSDAAWVITSALLAGAVATPVLGRLADLHGKRRMLVVALLLLVLGSVVCALSSSMVPLVIGRALQGCSVGVTPLGISLMRDTIPPKRLGSAVALMSSSLGIGSAIGLPISAFVLEHADWHMLFVGAGALGALTLALVIFAVPESSVRATGRFDVAGALGLSAGLVCLLLAISKGSDWGWDSRTTLGFIAGAVVLLAGWGAFELRTPSPLIDLRVSARRQVLLTNAASVMIGFAFYGSQLVPPQLLQLPTSTGYGLGQSMVAAGLCVAPLGLFMMLVSPVSARLITTRGPKAALLVGLAVVAVGYAAGLWLTSAVWQLVLLCAVVGIGVGLAFGAMPALIIQAVPRAATGAANGLNSLMRSIGLSTSSAVTGMVLASMTTRVQHASVPSLTGFRTALLVACAASVLGLVCAAFLPSTRHAPAGAVAVPVARPVRGIQGRTLGPDGAALPEAAITLIDRGGRQLGRAVSQADGRYELDWPGGGHYVLLGTAAGYQPEAVPLTGGDTAVEFDIVFTGIGRLAGGVRDAVHGNPLAGATVAAIDTSGQVIRSSVTGDDGAFDLTNLTLGRHTVAVTAPGRQAVALPVEVTGGTAGRMTAELWPTPSVSGTVRSRQGRPLPDIQVSLLDPAGNIITSCLTDVDGSYYFTDVIVGEYTIMATGHAPATAALTVSKAGTDSFDLALGHRA